RMGNRSVRCTWIEQATRVKSKAALPCRAVKRKEQELSSAGTFSLQRTQRATLLFAARAASDFTFQPLSWSRGSFHPPRGGFMQPKVERKWQPSTKSR